MLNNDLQGFDNKSMDINQGLENRQDSLMDNWMKQNPVPSINYNLPSLGSNKTEASSETLEGKLRGMAAKTPAPIDANEASFIKRESLPQDYFSERYPKYYLEEDNEDIAGRKQGLGEKLAYGVGRGLSSGTRAFLQSTIGLVNDIGSAVINRDAGKFIDNDLNRAFEAWQKADDKSMPLYQTEAEKNISGWNPKGWITGNHLAHLFETIGFMGGMAAGAWVTGGAGEFLGGARIGARMVAGYEEAVANLSNVSSKLAEISALQDGGEIAAQYSKKLSQEILSINQEAIPQAAKLEKVNSIINASKAEMDANFASAFSKFNKSKQIVYGAVSNLGIASSMGLETKESFKQAYIDKKRSEGIELTSDQLKKLDETANTVGNWVFTATGIMGAVSFGHMLKGIVSKGEMEAAVREEINNIGQRTILTAEEEQVGKKVIESEGIYQPGKTEFYDKSKTPVTSDKWYGKLGQRALGVAKVVKSYAGKVYNPWAGLGMAEFSLAPGTIEQAYTSKLDKYFDKRNKISDAEIWGDALTENLRKAFLTKEGLGEIFIGGLGTAPFEIASKIKGAKAREEATVRALGGINTTSLSPFLKALTNSIKNGSLLNVEEMNAIKEGDNKTQHDARSSRIQSYLYPRIRYGMRNLIDRDLEGYRRLAETEEGLKQLRNDGVIPAEGDLGKLRENFLAHLDQIKLIADEAESTYKTLSLKYGGNPAFADEHFEKLLYLSGMTDNASSRIKKLSEELSVHPDVSMDAKKDLVVLQQLMSKTVDAPKRDHRPIEKLVGKIIKDINSNGNITITKKQELVKKVKDMVSLTNDKASYLREYHGITINPALYKEKQTQRLSTETKETAQPDKIGPTIKLKHAGSSTILDTEGKSIKIPSDVEIGQDYVAGMKILPGEYNGELTTVKQFSKFRIEGEKYKGVNSNGEPIGRTIVISHPIGDKGMRIFQEIEPETFEKYKLAKLKDLQKNPAAMFYVDHANDIFTYQFQKNNPDAIKDGILLYDHDTKGIIFRYRGADGKVYDRPISLEEAKEDGRLKFKDSRKVISQEEYDRIMDYKDPQKAENFKRHSEIVNEEIEKVQKSLEEVESKIKDTTDQLNETKEELAQFEKDFTEKTSEDFKTRGQFSLTKYKKFVNSSIKNISIYNDIIKDYEKTISDLEAQKQHLQWSLEYMQDIFTDGDFLRNNSGLVTDEFKSAQSSLEKVVKESESLLSKLRSIVFSARNALYDATKTVRDLWNKFTNKYPERAQEINLSTQGIEDYLETAQRLKEASFDPEALDFSEGLDVDLPEVQKELNEIKNAIRAEQDADVNVLQKDIQSAKDNLEKAETDFKQLVAQLDAHKKLVAAFDKEYQRWWREELLTAAFRQSPTVDKVLKDMQKSFTANSGNVEPTSLDDKETLTKMNNMPFLKMRSLRDRPFADTIILDTKNRNTEFYKQHNNWPDRERVFFQNVASFSFQPFDPQGRVENIKPENISIIAINAEHQANHGFDGLIPDNYKSVSGEEVIENKGENRNNAKAAIVLVYVYDDNGTLYTLDRDGNLLDEVSKDNKQDLNNIVFSFQDTTSFKRTGLYKPGADKFHDVSEFTEAELNEIEAKATAERAKLLDEPGIKPQKFDLRGGWYNKHNVEEGIPFRNTSVIEAGILSDFDLDNADILSVATNVNPDNPNVALAEGTYITTGLAYVKQRIGNPVIVNTRRFNRTDADNIFNILKEMARMLVDGYSETKNEFEEGALQRLSNVVTNSKYEELKTFLENIGFFGKLPGGKMGRNQFYFIGRDLSIGKRPIKFDIASLDENEEVIKTLIAGTDTTPGLFHNVNVNTLKSKAGDPFTHLKVDENGNITERVEWKNYATYLLSDKNPDGSKRNKSDNDNNIPLTINSKKPNNDAGETAIMGRYIKIRGYGESFNPKPKEVPKKEEVKTQVKEDNRPVADASKTIKAGTPQSDISLDGKESILKIGSKSVKVTVSLNEDSSLNIKIADKFEDGELVSDKSKKDFERNIRSNFEKTFAQGKEKEPVKQASSSTSAATPETKPSEGKPASFIANIANKNIAINIGGETDISMPPGNIIVKIKTNFKDGKLTTEVISMSKDGKDVNIAQQFKDEFPAAIVSQFEKLSPEQREAILKPAEPVTKEPVGDIKAERADIERRRQEEINKLDVHGDLIRSFQEISKFGDTLSSALDNIAQKQKQLSNELNRKQKEDTKDRSIHQYTKEELEANPEYQEIKRLDKLVDTINRSVGKPENFEETVESHINYWVEQKKKAEASRSDKSKIGRINLKYDALGKKEADEKEPVKEPIAKTEEKTVTVDLNNVNSELASIMAKAADLTKQANEQGVKPATRPNTRIVQPEEQATFDVNGHNEFVNYLQKNLPGISYNEAQDVIKLTGGKTAWGIAKDNIITVFKGAPLVAKYHEAFHPVFDVFLNNRQKSDIMLEFRNRQGEFKDLESGKMIKYSDATDYQIADRLAEEFGIFKTTGTLPATTPKQMNFFKRLWTALKNIFRKPTTIEDIFKKIDEGGFRESQPIEYPGIINYRIAEGLKDFSEKTVVDNVKGISIEVMRNLRLDAGGLIKAVEGKITFKDLIDPVKVKFDRMFRLIDFDKDRGDYSPLMDPSYSLETKRYIANNWLNVLQHWDDYMDEVKSVLKTKGISFERAVVKNGIDIPEDGNEATSEIKEQSGDNTNSRDYGADVMMLDAKDSSPQEIKLLFGTIADERFFGNDEPLNVENPGLENPTSILSSTAMESFGNGDLYFYKTMAALANTPVSQIRGKFLELAKKHPPLVKVFKTIYGEPNDKGNGQSVDQKRLQILFENAFSKQTPIPLIQVVDRDGVNRIIDANADRDARQIANQFYSNMVALSATSEKVVIDSDGNYTFNQNVLRNPKHKDYVPTISDAGSETDRTNRALQFLNAIGFNFEKEVFDKLSDAKKKQVVSEAARLRNELAVKTKGSYISRAGMDTDAIDKLAELYVEADGAFRSSQYFNINNKPAPRYVAHNYFSTTLSMINGSQNREQLFAKKPYYKNDPFAQHSLLLKEDGLWFGKTDEKYGTRWKEGVKMSVTLAGGINSNGDRQETSKMNMITRFMQGFNMNLAGNFYNIAPADSQSEWGSQNGPNARFYVSPDMVSKYLKRTDNGYVNNIFHGYLKSEIELIKDYNTNPKRRIYDQLNKKVGETTIGQQLRFFKDILSKENRKLVEEYANGKGPDAELSTAEFVKKIESKINTDVFAFLNKKTLETKQFLTNNGIISKPKTQGRVWHGLVRDVNSKLGVGKMEKATPQNEGENLDYLYTDADIDKIIKFRTLNHFIDAIEKHKVFLGDPAIHKDAFKRIKLYMSGKNFTHIDGAQGNHNLVYNKEYNKVGSHQLRPGQTGYYVFSDTFKKLTYDLGDSNNTKMASSYWADLPEEYQSMNIVDAQSHLHLGFYREHKIKEGSWNDDREAQYQYDEAVFRKEATERFKAGEVKFEKFAYKNTKEDKALEKESQKIIDAGNPNIESAFHIDKPLLVGMYELPDEMIPFSGKTSSMALSWELVKGNDLEDMYLLMKSTNTAYAGPKSQDKFGTRANLPTIYDHKTGEISLTPEQILDYAMPVSMQDYGKILETSGTKNKITLGSQLTKLDTLGLFTRGIPNDYKPTLSYNERKKQWEQEKKNGTADKASKFYELSETKNKCLSALANKGFDLLINEIGITKESGNSYKLSSPEKLINFLNNEITRRELPDNMKDALGVWFNPESGEMELVNALETLVNFNQIRSIVDSLIDKRISSPKVTGKGLILASVAMFGKSGKDIRVETVNGKKILVSDRLKFYSKGKDGKPTGRMQVMMGNFMAKELKEKSGLSDAQLMRYLMSEQGKELLTGVGFRIPTQGINFVDSFEIVPFDLKYKENGEVDYENSRMFVPSTHGDMIIVPGELSTKAGSDFDVDKLFSYLKNFYIDENGYPKKVEFITDLSEKGLEKIYAQRKALATDFQSQVMAMLSDVQGKKTIQELENLQDEIAKELESIEKFIDKYKGETDPYKVNSKEAIENKYQENIHDLITHPDNYDKLVAPSSAEEMKGFEKKLEGVKNRKKSQNEIDLLNEQKLRKQQGDINYTELIDPLKVVEIRQKMLDGKNQVGLSATGNTGNSIAHSASEPIVMNTDQSENPLSAEDLKKIPLDESGNYDFSIKFKHNQVVRENKYLTTISGGEIKSDYIARIISQIIDGSVDAANDPWLMRVFPSKDAISTAVMLTRAGVEVNDTILFLNQPIIRELFKEQEKIKAIRFFDPKNRTSNESIVKAANAMFHSKENMFISDNFKAEDLEDMIASYEVNGKLTDKQRAYQRLILKEYQKYKLYADHLFEFQQATSWDTIDTPSRASVYLREKVLESTKSGNVFGDANQVIKDTFIGNRRDNLLKSTEAMSSIYKDTLRFVKPIWDAFSKRGILLGPDDKRAILEKANGSFIDFLTQVFYKPTATSRSVNNYIGKFFLTEAFANQLDKLQKENKAKRNTPEYNMVLGMLRIERQVYSKDVRNITLVSKPKDKDSSNSLTRSFKELKDKYPDLYRNIIVASHLQSGISDNRIAIGKFIPVEDYMVALKEGLGNLDNPDIDKLDAFIDTNQFYKNNWKNADIVPTVDQRNEVSIKAEPGNVINTQKVVMIQKGKYGSSNPAVKVMSYIDPETGTYYKQQKREELEESNFKITPSPRLYRRIEDSKGNPVERSIVNKKTGEVKTYFIYKQINALGDGANLQEYYDHNGPSQLNKHFKVIEDSDASILKAFNIELNDVPVDNEEMSGYMVENVPESRTGETKTSATGNKPVEKDVEITKVNYTRESVRKNPDTAYIFTENTHSIMAFPDKQGGGSAIIRPEPNAFAIVTKKKYDYNTKENVDYTDTPENFKEFVNINTKLIENIKNSGKSKIVFPQGFATDKAMMPTRFAEWLQKALLDNFGLVTELNDSKTGLISKSVIDKNITVKPTIDLSKEWKGDLESRSVYTKEGVNTMRTSAAKANEHFGNPFSEGGYSGTIKVASIGQAVVDYKNWLLGNDHKNVKPEQRAWILDQINQGKLDGATLLYAGKLEARGKGMHPTALAEVVEQLRKGTTEEGKKPNSEPGNKPEKKACP